MTLVSTKPVLQPFIGEKTGRKPRAARIRRSYRKRPFVGQAIKRTAINAPPSQRRCFQVDWTFEAQTTVWKVGALVGVGLAAIGLGAGYFDAATHFRFAFLSDHFGIFLIALLLGILSSFVCLIGWARRLKKTTRMRAAGIVFVSPWIAGMLGYPIDGFNVHGPSALLLFIIVPAASILALVLCIMAN